MSDIHDTYKAELRKRLGNDVSVSLFWKGRVALYAILTSIGVCAGDEVILPAFTCAVVPNAIIYLGARPIYVDIDPATYNIDTTKIEAAITTRTKVIIAQNTFGLSCDVDAVIQVARKYRLLVVEDCAHGFGGTYKGRSNGTVADAAFFSSQWSKPYSTGLGGIAVTKNAAIAEGVNKLEIAACKPKTLEIFQLAALIRLSEFILTPSTYTQLVKLYRTLSSLGLVIGSSQNAELQPPVLPRAFMKRMSAVQAKHGLRQLTTFDTHLVSRKSIATKYDSIVSDLGFTAPVQPPYAGHTFLRYTLQVSDKDSFLAAARKRNLECGDWFVSPIHPMRAGFVNWHYIEGSCPIAEAVSKHCVNLPTHNKINATYLRNVRALLKGVTPYQAT